MAGSSGTWMDEQPTGDANRYERYKRVLLDGRPINPNDDLDAYERGGIPEVGRTWLAGAKQIASGTGERIKRGWYGPSYKPESAVVPAPAVRPSAGMPSGQLKSMVSDIGMGALPDYTKMAITPAVTENINKPGQYAPVTTPTSKGIATELSQQYGVPGKLNLPPSPRIGPTIALANTVPSAPVVPAQIAPVATVEKPMTAEQKAIKQYQDFMQGSLQRGREALARWNETPEKYGYSAYTSAPGKREEAGRTIQKIAMQNRQNEQRMKDELEKERIKAMGGVNVAEAAAKGEIGKAAELAKGQQAMAQSSQLAKDTEAKRRMDELKLRGEQAKELEALRQKPKEQQTDKDKAKMLQMYASVLKTAEPGSPEYEAAHSGISELYGDQANTEAKIPEGATATDKNGKKIRYVGGKWVPV